MILEPIELFEIAGFTLYAHQALLAVAVLACGALCAVNVRRAGLPHASVLYFLPLAIVMGMLLAHLSFCLLRFGDVSYRGIGYLFRFWEGDDLHAYMLYGGMAGCAIAAWLAAKLAKASPVKLMDAIAPAAALMLCLVRVAQALAGQGHGRTLDEDSPLGFFPFAVYDSMYEMWNWAVFVPAALYLLIVAIVLWRGQGKRVGDATLLLLLLYAAAQITFESLRNDDVLRWGFVRCSQVFSAVVVAFVLLCYCLRVHKSGGARIAVAWVSYVLLLVVCLLMEFAIEKRISFLEFLEPAGCHVVMTVASALMVVNALGVRRFAQRA